MKSERILIFLMAVVQFTHILDFVIMMPLGPQLMRFFEIDAKSFALVVSSYTFSSAVFGFISAFWIDKFDRKKALMIVYFGFILGTFMCALAPTYVALLGARIFAGAFGGVVNTLVFTIVGDQIPQSRRGKATGVIMASFSVASVLGVPLGLFLAGIYNWHAPFFALVALALIVLFVLYKVLKPMSEHLNQSIGNSQKTFRESLLSVRAVVLDVNHQRAFALTMCLMFAAFSLIPFISPYMVGNVGLPESQLPLIYLCGGACTFFTSRYFGVLVDRYGMFPVFVRLALASMVPIFLLTHLTPIGVPFILLTSTFFMVLVSGRFVPAMALITSSASPSQRGSFMSVNNAIQHLSSGMAAVLAGSLMQTTESGALIGYDKVGYLAIAATAISLFLASRIRPRA